MSNKIELSKDELIWHLNEQLQFIKVSTNLFDKGEISEAKRIATSIRILLHDTSQSKSLLGQLKIKNGLKYLDSSFYDPNNLISTTGLVMLHFNSVKGARYKPKLNELSHLYKWIDFDDWWQRNIIIKDQKQNKFTRKGLILLAANQDGGAHVDDKINKEYLDLKQNSVGWKFCEKNRNQKYEADISDIELVSIRQIAFELLESIKRIGTKEI